MGVAVGVTVAVGKTAAGATAIVLADISATGISQSTSMQATEPVNSIDSKRCSWLPIDGRWPSSLGDATMDMVERAKSDEGCTVRSLIFYHLVRLV